MKEAERKSPALAWAVSRDSASYAFGRFRLRVPLQREILPKTSLGDAPLTLLRRRLDGFVPAEFGLQQFARLTEKSEEAH